ncbi:MAG: O-antigen ligase family protein [Candidatus Zhuqueibacterota bacterium]
MNGFGLKLPLPRPLIRPFLLPGLLALVLILVAFLVINLPVPMALGISVVIVVFAVSFFKIKIALAVLIFSMLLSPEIGVRETGGGGTTIRIDDFLIFIISVAWLMKMAVTKEFGTLVRSSLSLPILLYVATCAVATAVGIAAGRVEAKTGVLFVIKYAEYFLIYFIVMNHMRERKLAELYLTLVFATCALVCCFALYQVPADGRVTAPFEGASGEPNTLGGYLVLIFSMMMGIFLTAPFSRTMRWVYGSVLALIFFVLLATQSRGSWLAFAAMYLAFVVFHKGRFALTLVMVIALLFGPLVLPNSVKDRFRYTFKKESGWAARYQENVAGLTLDTSASARVRDWKEAWQQFKSRPVLGDGVTGWKFVDSQYIRTLVETGIVGLAAFLFLIGALIRQTYLRFRAARDKVFRGVCLGFLAGTIGLLVHGLSANSFIILRIMEPFWFLAGIVMVSDTYSEKENLEQHDDETTGRFSGVRESPNRGR